jgi:hypothetical protein
LLQSVQITLNAYVKHSNPHRNWYNPTTV